MHWRMTFCCGRWGAFDPSPARFGAFPDFDDLFCICCSCHLTKYTQKAGGGYNIIHEEAVTREDWGFCGVHSQSDHTGTIKDDWIVSSVLLHWSLSL